MRHTVIRRPGLLAGLPAAIIGSLAVALGAAPAVAAEPEVRAETRQAMRSSGAGLGVAAVRTVASAEAAARVVPASSGVPATCTVRKGDTVWAIASRYRLRVADVLAWNGLSKSAVIHPGQVLRLKATTKSASAKSAPASAAKKVHVVARGDTVTAIAKKHGVSVARVLSANGLASSSIIYPGQKLVIPGASTKASPSVTPKKAAATTAAKTHTVRSGDTVSAIAAAYGRSVAAVLSANGLGMSSIIYPGQKLVIPGATSSPAPASTGSATTTLDKEQRANAKLIIRVGRQLGVPERGIAIALGTAMQESWLRNLDWGDRDSLGLFQQRPSTGWGTAKQIRDAERSIRVFFGGPHDPNGGRTRGLLDVKGWQRMSFAQAAQAVQISAYPARYAKWEDDAYAWLKALG